MTTCKCTHLVTGGHFWWCKKDGGHAIRSAIGENHVLYALHHSLCYWRQVIGDEIFNVHGSRYTQASIAWVPVVDLLQSCDLDLDLMTFIHELYPYCLEIHLMCKYELLSFLCQGFWKLSSDIHTCIHTKQGVFVMYGDKTRAITFTR